MAQIENKAKFFYLWDSGVLGNKLRSWNSLEDIKADGYTGLLSMRVKRHSGGGSARYNVKQEEVSTVLKDWTSQGVSRNEIFFNESAPDEMLVTQGELMISSNHYDLFYSEEKAKMRDAMKNGKSMSGLKALLYLKKVMTPSSYEDLIELFELYPDSVIEFGVYDMCLGCYPNRNCIIWEIRNY